MQFFHVYLKKVITVILFKAFMYNYWTKFNDQKI